MGGGRGGGDGSEHSVDQRTALIRYQVRYVLDYVKSIDNDLITTRYEAR